MNLERDPYLQHVERVERTRSFDVWHEVPLVPQQTGMSCWAAAAAMLLGWRDATHVDPEDVARGAGKWGAYRDGLRPCDVVAFARHWGLVVEPPRSYSVSALRRLLEENGPLWMGEASPGLHVIVVAGLFGDGTVEGTQVRVLDPWPDGLGERYVVSFAELMRCFEGVAQVVGVHAQVLHTGGRGNGARSVRSSYQETRHASWRVASDPTYGAPVGLFAFCRSPEAWDARTSTKQSVHARHEEDTAMLESHSMNDTSFKNGKPARITTSVGLDWSPDEARRVAACRALYRVTPTPPAIVRGSVGRGGANDAADVREVQRRLRAVGVRGSGRLAAEAPAQGATGPVAERALRQTIAVIRRFQDSVRWWMRYPSGLTDKNQERFRTMGLVAPTWSSTTVTDGQIAPGDASFEHLQRVAAFDIHLDGTPASEDIHLHDHARSRYTLFRDGFDWTTTDARLRATAVPLDWYTSAGLTETEAFGVMFVSSHEGGFDGFNSWDRAVLTFGFVQFTVSGSLQGYLARLKREDPAAFTRIYRDFGIDVGDGRNPELLVLDANGRVLRGTEAARRVGTDPLLAAVFIRSGRDPVVQRQQVIAAVNAYALSGLNKRVTYTPPGGTASSATFREILVSAEAITTLIDRTVAATNAGPELVGRAVVTVARAAGLTDLRQVRTAQYQAAIVAEVERVVRAADPQMAARIVDIQNNLAGYIARRGAPASAHGLDGDDERLSEPQELGHGEATFSNTPVLRAHHPTRQPDLVLRWNDIPTGVTTVDVVLHIHGFSGDGAAMSLVNKARRSGLDLMRPGRSRPTLGVIPRGQHAPYTDREGVRHDDPYHFPLMHTQAGVRALVDHALQTLSSANALGTLRMGRFIVTAHSGGGAPTMRLLAATAGSDLEPHEVHLFDATYGAADALIAWARRRIDRDRAAPNELPGAMRVLFIAGSGTASQALRVHQAVQSYLGADATRVGRRYAVENVHRIAHGDIPERFGGRLLAQADVDVTPDATTPTPPRAHAHGLDDGDGAAPDVQSLDAAEDTAQWNDNPRVHDQFEGGLDTYLRMAPMYHAKGIANPARYLRDNITNVTFFSRTIPAHRAMQAPLAAAERALLAQGYTPPINSFWSLVVRPIRGTKNKLSKHAAGRAVDINPDTNPRITNPDEYRVIRAVTGIDISHKRMAYDTLATASRLFKERFDTWLAALDVSVPEQAELQRAAHDRAARLRQYARLGFLDLDLRLVTALRDAGLHWGGDWGSAKDFMHFELTGW